MTPSNVISKSSHPGKAAAPTPKPSERRLGIGVLGATGYSGFELLRLLAGHPHAEVRAVGSRQLAGGSLGTAWPGLGDRGLILDDDPTDPGPWIDRGVEIVFSALPHGAFAARAEAFLEAGLRLIDLSADFRLRDPQEYRRRYGIEHPAPQLLAQAVYGLPEWKNGALLNAHLVANPGCYATAVLLATLPPVTAGLWSGAPIVANAMSGVSGAGRAATPTTHFMECDNNVAPYKVASSHPHVGEMCQALELAWQAHAPETKATSALDVPLVFNPHLVPIGRGILATVAVPLDRPVDIIEARALYAQAYEGRACVRVLGDEALPETRYVRGANRCDLAIRVAASGRMLLAYAAIDNLTKGAAGQAIQNWNLLMGWPEALGLPLEGWQVA